MSEWIWLVIPQKGNVVSFSSRNKAERYVTSESKRIIKVRNPHWKEEPETVYVALAANHTCDLSVLQNNMTKVYRKRREAERAVMSHVETSVQAGKQSHAVIVEKELI